ncbi:hypothetical protein BgiBS90_002981 [Biomphalaria glabrata]|nr:hypothetical protein BgiBS90_002981 [Biomphalaria glabrata]
MSRCKMTTPQICKYYNNDRQKCTKRHCTSLHICSQFILQEHQNCKKNHSFQDDQVRKTLEDLFDIGEQSTDDNQEMYSDFSNIESNYTISLQVNDTIDIDQSQSSCHECRTLKQEPDALKLEMSQKVKSFEQKVAQLKSEVQCLKQLYPIMGKASGVNPE